MPLNATLFRTESGYDKLTVNDVEHSGSSGPDGITPAGTIVWSSDGSVTDIGWELCAPFTPSPPSPPSSPSLPPSPPVLPSPPLPPPLLPGHRNVNTVEELIFALSNNAIDHISIAPGTYPLSSQLEITRNVTIEATQPGSVVLDAQASSSSQRRGLYINGGALDVIEISGVNITGGFAAQVPSLH